MSDVRSFNRALATFAEQTVPDKVRDFRDAVALECLKGVVLLTPVDTGRMRGNWQTTIQFPAEGYDEDAKDKTGGKAIREGTNTIATARNPWVSIWLHNGVPYAEYVNDGTGKNNAPAVHMVERTVDRVARRFGGGV